MASGITDPWVIGAGFWLMGGFCTLICVRTMQLKYSSLAKGGLLGVIISSIIGVVICVLGAWIS
jgi:hypothetical protein